MSTLVQDLHKAVLATRGGEERAARVERRPWFHVLARTGLCARGVIYLELCFFAATIAVRGNSPAPANGEGAIAEAARQPGGPALVVVLIVGLGAYGFWRAVEAITGRENPGRVRTLWVRIGWLAVAALYLGLCARAIELLIVRNGTSAGSGSGSARAWAGRVLALPGGPAWLGLAGTGLLIGAVALAVWGLAHDYGELRLDRLPRRLRPLPRIVGGAGDLSRGALLSLVAVYLFDAAVDGRSTRVKTAGLALRSLAGSSYGLAVVATIAAGLFCYAVYSFLEAWLRDL